VAGIAAFGDVRECVDRRTFESPVRLISVKVVNNQGQFDEVATVPEQMQTAIRALHERGAASSILRSETDIVFRMTVVVFHRGPRRSIPLPASLTL
jgi:hypothetical protein